ncbi:outer membrane protein transport protein (OMPP1/FadL/TodX) [Flavobacterium croceum DSM 17960]|uniref:Outer membrane protein transport protein (OMPP1/FadL/TodX) n=1 Tax=Flavobacterium croceum DSM 17960 TaxID=1121886 RepID=A0A2S4N5C5_9FLAO|nr:outer membrane protein transport protein [Flavobacterium croceum]POS00876.1 outer membrane protein transport protein (OMPP1/FadL/TodX) [Flavobacterium croceum DSM 17960]
MKKIYILALSLAGLYQVNAQNVDDALRYSINDVQGTARFKAMSGAFGALGGDLSAISVNPAGSSVFNNNQLGFSLSNFNTQNNSTYFGTQAKDSENKFSLNQAGAVFVYENRYKKSDWKKFSFALNYDNVRDLNNAVTSTGTNPTKSIGSYFYDYSYGIPLNTANGNNYDYGDMYYDEQQTYLGYQSYILDYGTNDYINNISTQGNYYQNNRVYSTGYNGKLAFNFSTQYTDKWYFGINLNSHFVDYRQSSNFFESNNNPKYASGSTVDRVRFYNDLYTYGSGFSFQLGTIFKPSKEVRIGFTYDSPTWFKLYDELTQSIATSGYGLNNAQDNSIYGSVTVNPNTTMIYEPYKLKTPQKLTGSLAYVFGKQGLLSVDYSLKDYCSTKYNPHNDFTRENNFMRDNLRVANEFRVGGEYKIKMLSLRAGYRFEQSPYKDGKTMGDLTGYSGGIGYNFGSTKLDVAYSFAKRDYYSQFFNVGLTDASKISMKNNNVTLSVLFEL